MIENASKKELDMIILGNLNYDYVIKESLHSHPIHYIESLYDMSQLITEKTRVTSSTESTLDLILTTNPSLYKRSGVMKKTLSDHDMTLTELSVPKKVLQGNHNTVTFRNYNNFDYCEFINDVKSNDLLNGNCKEVKWNEWKDAFLHISNAHAPTKTTRLKVRCNTWITRDIVKMMYDSDWIHELAVKRKDTVLMEKYRRMRNTITDIIKSRKREYFSEVSNSVRSSPRSFWSELNTMIPKIDMKSIPKDMGAKDFNINFKNVPDVITSSLTIVLCYGRVRKVYIRLHLMKFSGRIFYDFLHCYQIKLVWTS